MQLSASVDVALQRTQGSKATHWHMLQALGVTVTNGYKQIKVEEPAKRKGGVMVSSVSELIDKLKNEAKVL